jgi:DNA-binding NarL/FixJ family response regulator
MLPTEADLLRTLWDAVSRPQSCSRAQRSALSRTRPEDLLAAIHTVAAGDSLRSPSVTSRVIERMARHPAPDTTRDARRAALTHRERKVLELVARGFSTNRSRTRSSSRNRP